MPVPGLSAPAIGIARQLEAQIDQLPGTRLIWSNILKVSLGAFFEIYEVALTGLLGALLVQAGIFRAKQGFFGLPDLATFSFATFGGLCIGVLASSFMVDRHGRRPLFVTAPLIYGAATLVMATRETASAICFWRFVAAVGIGAQVVAADAYLAELAPKAMRGRGFAVSKAIQYSAVPVATVMAALASRGGVAGVAGWRFLLIVPVLGAVGVWWFRHRLPESPRWLTSRGRLVEAECIVADWAGSVDADDKNNVAIPPAPAPYSDLFRRPLRRRVAMMIVAGGASSIAYYGFGTWLPSIIEARGVAVTKSLIYTAMIALIFPLTPLCLALVADRVERKWQIVAGAGMAAAFGLAFAGQSTAAGWILCGLLIGVGNNVMACASHTYRSELFPTVLRGRAIGLVYACDRLVAAFGSYLIGWLFVYLGAHGVLLAVAVAALLDMAAVGALGPRTRGRSFEETLEGCVRYA